MELYSEYCTISTSIFHIIMSYYTAKGNHCIYCSNRKLLMSTLSTRQHSEGLTLQLHQTQVLAKAAADTDVCELQQAGLCSSVQLKNLGSSVQHLSEPQHATWNYGNTTDSWHTILHYSSTIFKCSICAYRLYNYIYNYSSDLYSTKTRKGEMPNMSLT